jgi:FKBP-type peptidyl-prolyl cis-trans isomerase
MKFKMRTITFLFLAILSFMGCNGCGEKKNITDLDIQREQQKLIKETKKAHEEEMKAIGKFVEERKWPMQVTNTGLHYWIFAPGNGQVPKPENRVAISYTITLLDGTECYSTPDENPKEFVVEQDNVETGLHEAIQLMHTGDRAKFILPSHLAFGLTGDSGKIPPNASVLYDIHLIAIQQ